MKVIIVGGSICGCACAHALLKIGCEVVVLERATSVTAAGAGLGLGEKALDILRGFGLAKELEAVSLPMGIEVNLLTNLGGTPSELHRDELYNHRSVHWSDLHRILIDALPPQARVRFGHTVTDLRETGDGVVATVRVKAAPGADGEARTEEFAGDLAVAADGQMSETRRRHVGDERRYSGYCAWRGVVRDSEAPEAAAAARRAYPELGSALYFEMSEQRTHAVLYELPGQRLNWLWYVNQPEPELKSYSVSVKADAAKLERMHADARETFSPALAQVMAATPEPWINAIFDREPLRRWAFGRCALVGEAAHPTSPHGLRSTNMAIEDAHALASALAAARDPAGVAAALGAFERERTAATAREVLFSRHLGRIKQGLSPPCARVQPAERERSGQAAAASADGAGLEAPARDGGGHAASGRDGGCGWAAASAAERRALGQANMAKFPVPPHLLQREA